MITQWICHFRWYLMPKLHHHCSLLLIIYHSSLKGFWQSVLFMKACCLFCCFILLMWFVVKKTCCLVCIHFLAVILLDGHILDRNVPALSKFLFAFSVMRNKGWKQTIGRAFNIFQVYQYFTIYMWYFFIKMWTNFMNILCNTL
jgi:hypothetical protein